jgi:pimeloyl-ACP methyl ester carboxylesterase
VAQPLSVVLVHGGFVDGSGWEGVHRLLRKDGHDVSVVQHATATLAGDVVAVKAVLSQQRGPVILVGHSYGGAVITEAGTAPNVAGLVYVAAFAPDRGESVDSLIANPPPGAPVPPIVKGPDGNLVLDRAKFPAAFAADVEPEHARFMADSQLPWGPAASGTKITDPAWRHRPSWYVLTTEDRMIPPAAQRIMAQRAGSTIIEAKGSHSIYVSQPAVVANVIRQATSALGREAHPQP